MDSSRGWERFSILERGELGVLAQEQEGNIPRQDRSRSPARRAAPALPTEAPTSQNSSPSESDELDAGGRMVDLLHRTSCRQAAEVDRGEPRVLERRDHHAGTCPTPDTGSWEASARLVTQPNRP